VKVLRGGIAGAAAIIDAQVISNRLTQPSV